MTPTTSRLMDFLSYQDSFVIERCEVASVEFSNLRRAVRLIVDSISQNDDSHVMEISGRLRAVLSEWLTAPVRFDDSVKQALAKMGEPATVKAHWGHDISALFDDAWRAAERLDAVDNPVRAILAGVFQDLANKGCSFRIFCHKRSRVHFDSIPETNDCEALPGNVFLHSAVDYRKAELFDVLIKIGPLRARGWGAVPDALITAPRFSKLIQIVWSGCMDEDGFGFDPVSSLSQPPDNNPSAGKQYDIPILGKSWKVDVSRQSCGTLARPGDLPDEDELGSFAVLAKRTDLLPATLVQLDEAHGILYAPHSRVLSMADTPDPIQERLPGETLQEGMFVILPKLNDQRFSDVRAEEGHFSNTWKEELRKKCNGGLDELANRLWDAGLTLLGLHSCIRHWCSPATTVVHAPQQKKHFKILMRELGLMDFPAQGKGGRPKAAWWEFAWDEVRRSRGEAIQAGVQDQQLIDSVVKDVLTQLHEDIRSNMGKSTFQLDVPPDSGLSGAIWFYQVLGVELGFRAPRGELRTLCELERIEAWRE